MTWIPCGCMNTDRDSPCQKVLTSRTMLALCLPSWRVIGCPSALAAPHEASAALLALLCQGLKISSVV